MGEADPKRQAQRAAKGLGAGGQGGCLARGRAPRQRGTQRPARARRRSEVPLPATGRPIRCGSTMETANGLGAAPAPSSASVIANGILLLPASSAARTGSSTGLAADDGLDLADGFVGQEPVHEVQRGFVVAGLGGLVFRLILHSTKSALRMTFGKLPYGVRSPIPNRRTPTP